MATNKQEQVSEVKSATAERLDAVKAKFAEVRIVLANARKERDAAVGDANKAYGESYDKAREQMRSDIEDLEQAYSQLRSDICDRWSAESANLTETHDSAVAAANKAYGETQEASRVVFGDDN